MPTPGEAKAAVTGVLAAQGDKAADEREWTVEELRDAKPILVYYFVDGINDQPMNDNYKFSRSFEFGLQSKVIEELNQNWRCKKIGLPGDADLSKPENQARIELWSALGTKMAVITVDKRGQTSANALRSLLKREKSKNDSWVAKEIKRLEKLEKQQQSEETAAK
jgi:hypothetical protein